MRLDLLKFLKFPRYFVLKIVKVSYPILDKVDYSTPRNPDTVEYKISSLIKAASIMLK